jgi:hypothetical protein
MAVGIGKRLINNRSTVFGQHIQKYTRLLQIYEFLVENGFPPPE